MKLLLSDEEMNTCTVDALGVSKSIAQAQLKHIFNLDIKTTSELIVKLEARLDELYQKEVAK